MDAESGDPGIASRFTVVLWLTPGGTAPARLVRALTARTIQIQPVSSAFGALATVCAASRSARQSRASVGGIALVMVHPELQPDAKGVFDAAAKFAPGVRCWMYGPAANPKLRALVESDVAQWGGGEGGEVVGQFSSQPEIVVRQRAVEEAEGKPMPGRPRGPVRQDYRTPVGGKPSLRLAGEGRLDPAPEAVDVEKKGPETDGETAPIRGQVLTPEELRMLLGDDDPDVAGQR